MVSHSLCLAQVLLPYLRSKLEALFASHRQQHETLPGLGPFQRRRQAALDAAEEAAVRSDEPRLATLRRLSLRYFVRVWLPLHHAAYLRHSFFTC